MRRVVFRALLVAAVLASGHLWVARDKTVLLDVDGQQRTLRTFATTVEDVLARAQLPVGAHDAVVPAPDTRISDGGRIVIRRGRQLDLVVNGKRSTVWVTALSVEEALRQVNVRVDQTAFVSASRSRGIPLDGMAVEVRLPARVRLVADGASRDVVTTAATVRELLAEAGVTLAATDSASVALSAYPSDGLTLRITRIRGRELVETTVIPRDEERRPDPTMYRGKTKVLESGIDGLRVSRYSVTLVDGKVTSKRLVSRKVTREPKTRVIAFGTKDPRFQTCKSTWYHRSGMVAAHRTLPKGTIVRVVNLANGKSVTVTIDDRGPYGGPDYCIDLGDDAFARIAHLGTGVISVRLTW